MSRSVRVFAVTSLLAALSLGAAVGCKDPAADKKAAAVGDAKPAPAYDGKRPDGALELVAADSKIEFTGSKVNGKHDGKFQTFTGWIHMDGDKLDSAKMYIDIDVASLKTDSEKLDGHLRNDDFFAVDKHPKAVFKLTEIKAGGDGGTHTITGNLEMRGKEKSITFPANVTLSKDDVRATAEFKINRKDWGILYDGQQDNLIRDDVVLRLDVHAKK